MKTKILILVFAKAMLSFGNLSQAQEMKPLSASNKAIVVQSSLEANSQASVANNENPALIATDEAEQLVRDAQLHSQITLRLQQFLESRELDERICSDVPQDCDYEFSYSFPSIVY